MRPCNSPAANVIGRMWTFAGVVRGSQERQPSSQAMPVIENSRVARTTTFLVTVAPGCTEPRASSWGLTVTAAITRPSTSIGICVARGSSVTRSSCPFTYPAGASGLSRSVRS